MVVRHGDRLVAFRICCVDFSLQGGLDVGDVPGDNGDAFILTLDTTSTRASAMTSSELQRVAA